MWHHRYWRIASSLLGLGLSLSLLLGPVALPAGLGEGSPLIQVLGDDPGGDGGGGG
jgi:hypothetical protein